MGKGCSRFAAALSLSKNQNQPLGADFGAIFVFPATSASEKLLSSENRFLAVFKGTGAVLAGIECRPKIFDFRASGIPVQERGDFVDTLTARQKLPGSSFVYLFSVKRKRLTGSQFPSARQPP